MEACGSAFYEFENISFVLECVRAFSKSFKISRDDLAFLRKIENCLLDVLPGIVKVCDFFYSLFFRALAWGLLEVFHTIWGGDIFI